MTEIPQKLAANLDETHKALSQFSQLIEKEPEKISDAQIEKLMILLKKNCNELNQEASRDWSAVPKVDIDDELTNRILNTIAFIRGNAQATTRFANLGNVFLNFWKTLRRTQTDIKNFRKRIKVEKVDDIGFGPGQKK